MTGKAAPGLRAGAVAAHSVPVPSPIRFHVSSVTFRLLGWSLNLFRVRGIQLAVHFSFLLLLAYVAWEGWQSEPEHRWLGALVSAGLYLVFFTCVVLHEFGHSFTAMHYGVGVRRILLMPIGGMAEFDSIPREPRRELWITLAGPAVNFAIAGILWLCVGLPDGWQLFSTDNPFEGYAGYAQVLLQMNLIMGLFNLVPVFPMDGGRILRAMLATRLPYLRATFVAATIGKILAVAAIVVAVTEWDHPLMAALFAFIFVAGELEYRAARRREAEEAHWRAVVARLYGSDAPVEEPPAVLR